MRTVGDDLRRVFLCTETPKTTLNQRSTERPQEKGLRKQGQQHFLSYKNQRFSIPIIKIMRFHLQKQDILCRQQAVAEVKTLLPNSFDGEPQSLNQKCKEIAVEAK